MDRPIRCGNLLIEINNFVEERIVSPFVHTKNGK